MEDITIQDLITEQKNRISTLQYHDAMLHIMTIRIWIPIISGLKKPKDS